MVDLSNSETTPQDCGETHRNACACREAYFRRIELALLFYGNAKNYGYTTEEGVILSTTRVDKDAGAFARLALGIDKEH